MQCFRALRQLIEIAFEHFGEAVEQRPERADIEISLERFLR
jgi:hypothetical protein